MGLLQSRVGGAVLQAGLQAALRHLRCGRHVGVSRAIAVLLLQSAAARAHQQEGMLSVHIVNLLGETPGGSGTCWLHL